MRRLDSGLGMLVEVRVWFSRKLECVAVVELDIGVSHVDCDVNKWSTQHKLDETLRLLRKFSTVDELILDLIGSSL